MGARPTADDRNESRKQNTSAVESSTPWPWTREASRNSGGEISNPSESALRCSGRFIVIVVKPSSAFTSTASEPTAPPSNPFEGTGFTKL